MEDLPKRPYIKKGEGSIMKRLLALVLVLAMLLPAGALAATRTMKLGQTGEDVKELQVLLSNNGCYTGAATGTFDVATATAVKSFQKVNRLTVDGKAGTATMAKLNSGTAVNAMEVQQRLKDLNYYDGDVDGNFGALSVSAVKAFQKANGFDKKQVNGVLNSATLNALYASDAKPKAEDAPIVGGTLSSGSYGDAVELLQEELRATYYYTGKVDGFFGPEVRAAVENFQASAGLRVDGKYGTSSYNALHNQKAAIFNGGIPVRTLKTGMRGYDVYVLQQKLISMNYTSVSAIGYYDAKTATAVQSIQRKNSLEETGVVGSMERRYIWPTNVDQEDMNQIVPDKDETNTDYTRVLKKGRSGNDVAMLQMRLKAANYLFGKADGIFGEKTEAAVKKFQKAMGLAKVDGIVGEETWAEIYNIDISNAEQDNTVDPETSIGTNNRKLRQGSHGTDVKRLQQKLIEKGYLASGEDDGKFGPKTYEAVVAFQNANGLVADGVVGTQTFNALFDDGGAVG